MAEAVRTEWSEEQRSGGRARPVDGPPIAVVGGGSFGTALAVCWASAGHPVRLWVRRSELAEEVRRSRRNEEYLPGVEIPPEVEITSRLEDLQGCDPVVLVVPSHGFRGVLRSLLDVWPEGDPLVVVSAAKGIEPETLARMSEVTRQEAESHGRELGGASGRQVEFAVLSGPSFAVELARGAATAAVIAADDAELARRLRQQLASPTFRLYSSSDLVGVELGGTVKNVIAIAAGIVAGLGLGHNSLAALITRGLHEITRLGLALGGQPRTFAGLAGLGDLVVTCTGGLSRNRAIGVALAEGETLAEIAAGTQQVAEGVKNSLAIAQLARKEGVSMPITEQMVEILYQDKSPSQALRELMSRELKAEAEL